eukprot:GHVN01050895.1.p2 GENE.GHVN01050895.1~~GHVN01050895.1.p2  ORF type:complete len:101 (-),score=10.47 GHVN01050895.1:484-786(-)
MVSNDGSFCWLAQSCSEEIQSLALIQRTPSPSPGGVAGRPPRLVGCGTCLNKQPRTLIFPRQATSGGEQQDLDSLSTVQACQRRHDFKTPKTDTQTNLLL